MHRLLPTQQSHHQEQVPFTSNWRLVRPTEKSDDIGTSKFEWIILILQRPPSEPDRTLQVLSDFVWCDE